MTTPGRIQEIIQEMERDPQLTGELRERILGQGFLQIQAATAQNQTLIIQLMERQVELSGATRTALDAVLSNFQQFGEIVTGVMEAQDQRLGKIEETQEITANRLGGVEDKLGAIEPAVSDLRKGQDDIRKDLGEVRAHQRRTDGRLDRGFGANYEAKVSRNIRTIMGQQLGIRNPRVLKDENSRADEDFEKLLEQMESKGIITEEEADDLMLIDIIVAGTQREDRAKVYVAAEISITANQNDVDRAAARAGILQRVTGISARPVVIADRIDEHCRQLAGEKGVAVATYPE